MTEKKIEEQIRKNPEHVFQAKMIGGIEAIISVLVEKQLCTTEEFQNRWKKYETNFMDGIVQKYFSSIEKYQQKPADEILNSIWESGL